MNPHLLVASQASCRWTTAPWRRPESHRHLPLFKRPCRLLHHASVRGLAPPAGLAPASCCSTGSRLVDFDLGGAAGRGGFAPPLRGLEPRRLLLSYRPRRRRTDRRRDSGRMGERPGKDSRVRAVPTRPPLPFHCLDVCLSKKKAPAGSAAGPTGAFPTPGVIPIRPRRRLLRGRSIARSSSGRNEAPAVA